MIAIKIIVLFLFLLFVEKNPKLKPYTTETQFNIYRSLMCLYFALYSLDITINNFSSGCTDPINFRTESFSDIAKWFIAYLTVDIGKMIWMKNTRLDLYIHHIWCLILYMLALYNNKIGFLHIIALIGESISIVSGIDSIYLEENNLEKSKNCKLYRKNIIKYIRKPIWVISIFLILQNSDRIPSLFFWNGLITLFIIVILDIYWEKKCDKVLSKQ
jgi:hypothetical protein